MVERYTAVMARDDSIVRQSAEQYSPLKDCDRLVLPVAMTYADPEESAFDLYRRQLYIAVGWPPPRAGREESATGQCLTGFLWRGTLPDSIRRLRPARSLLPRPPNPRKGVLSPVLCLPGGIGKIAYTRIRQIALSLHPFLPYTHCMENRK